MKGVFTLEFSSHIKLVYFLDKVLVCGLRSNLLEILSNFDSECHKLYIYALRSGDYQ